MDESKKWWESKTVIDAIVAFGCMLLSIFSVAVTPELREILSDNLVVVFSGVAALIAMIKAIKDRVQARKVIK